MLAAARRYFEPSKDKLGAVLGRLGVAPSWVTLSGLLLALLAAWIYARWGPFWAALCGTVASLTDFVDGAVARYQGRQSAWGNYLEAVVDRLVELTLLLTMASDLGPIVAWAIASSMFVSYCKPRVALVVAADNHDWPGVGDHADRMVLILVSMALCQFSLGLARVAMGLLVLMTAVGGVQRLRYAYRLIQVAQPSKD